MNKMFFLREFNLNKNVWVYQLMRIVWWFFKEKTKRNVADQIKPQKFYTNDSFCVGHLRENLMMIVSYGNDPLRWKILMIGVIVDLTAKTTFVVHFITNYEKKCTFGDNKMSVKSCFCKQVKWIWEKKTT